MKLAIMQPYFLPYIGYWQLMNAVDKYVIYDDVNFMKRGWINRNRILMNGKAKIINIQMYGASQNKLINEVELLGDKKHNKKLLRTLESCYKKAPYFSSAYPIVEKIINKEEQKLIGYLEYSIKQICEYLSINTELIVSSTINKNNDLKGQDKILEICKILGVDEYYNAIGGQELYSYEDFESQNIKLKFLKTERINYKQFNDEFVPNLSIIDLMMFNSKEDIKKMLEQYELL
ncbi:WbqC family protein [Tissierella sp. MSJ-40]|uniref:WbqC family protein n=1 Tax=Tissierella simiarum TaxID=2841534 RepID=A0ABS6E323_9FIRM|nr:WbqC family protein [Tissierella simiarum]MBU5436659.1 WbqC family protein [Tissierella simiarum]